MLAWLRSSFQDSQSNVALACQDTWLPRGKSQLLFTRAAIERIGTPEIGHG
jgi:hypothetical protein